MRPWLLRPACVGMDSSRVFSGSSVVISSKPDTDMKRRPGLVGLNFLIGMFFLYAPEKPFDFAPHEIFDFAGTPQSREHLVTKHFRTTLRFSGLRPASQSPSSSRRCGRSRQHGASCAASCPAC